MVLEKLKAIFASSPKNVEEQIEEKIEEQATGKKMKVAILGAGCYRTHAASGITNFSRACEVAEITGKENIYDSLYH